MQRRSIFIVLILTCLLLSNIIGAQQFGGNPPATRWRQINSDTARIIFPKGLDSAAGQVASFIRQLSLKDTFSLGRKLNKINMVLQNQPVITNGYVSMGPFRSELYLTPSPDNFDPSSLSWPNQLTIHEYRHVQQYNNFNNGLSAVFKRLFGQEGYALAINAAVPDWFFEGDAVFSETQLAPHGRGTLPYFLKAYPSLWQAGKNYSWAKLRNGSLKGYVPNHYDLGYLFVNYGTQKYGYDFWRKVTRDASAYKGLFYPMQSAVRRHSGLTYRAFRDSAFAYYKNKYSLPEPPAYPGISDVFPAKKTGVNNYYFPYQTAETSLLYLKSTYNKRPAFYEKTGPDEKPIRFRDISIEEQYGYRNGRIVYAAYESHPRWSWISYSVIKVLDVATNKQRTLRHKTRYFTPDISEDGTLVVANQVALNGRSSLVLLNALDGRLVKEISDEKVAYFSNPKIIDNHTVISVLRNRDATSGIARIDLLSGQIEYITPPSTTVIGTIDVQNDRVYFTASQKLKDELFYFDLPEKQLYKANTSGAGSYFISSGYGKLSWSSFTAGGYTLQQQDSNAVQWQRQNMNIFTNNATGIVAGTRGKYIVPDSTPANFKVRPYRKLTHPFNFHSWRPNYSAPEFSFTIYGNNVLNTTQSQLYYLYNENDKTHTAGGSLAYGGLFPLISVGSNYTFDRQAFVVRKLKQWNERNSYVGLQIPLSWAGNRTYKSLNIGSNYFYRRDFNKGLYRNDFSELQFSYLSHSIGWGQQVQTTVQDIYPRFGYSASTLFRHTLNVYKSWQSYAGLAVYLPGVARTHSLVLTGAVQYTGSDQRIFGSRIAFARGYGSQDSAGVYTTRVNYHFPIWYADWGFANIFYLQRVRGNLFYDHTQMFNKAGTKKSGVNSAGAEVYLDTKWWNQHPVTFGFRAGYLLTAIPGMEKKAFFEFILPTSLIPK